MSESNAKTHDRGERIKHLLRGPKDAVVLIHRGIARRAGETVELFRDQIERADRYADTLEQWEEEK